MRHDLKEWVMNVCRDKIRPAIVPFFEVVRRVKDNHDIAIVRMTRGYDVHALWHNNTNRYLIRVGTQSREASQEELARLFQQRGSVRAELRPVSGATLANLNRRRLRNYFVDIRQQDVPDDEDEEAWQSLLVNTEVMTEEGVTVEALPSLRREAIDEAVGAAAVPTELTRFRNLVFHLGGDGGDMEDTEYQFVDKMEHCCPVN